MATPLQNAASRRRSERVSIAFPLEASGVDASGTHFREKTKTTTVSRFGCCVSLPRMLPLRRQISLHRLGTDERAVGKIVAQMGAHAEGYLYGVGTWDSCEPLWGIRFCPSFDDKLLNSTNDAIYFVNRDRKVTYWNEGAERLTGYSANEAIGKDFSGDLLEHVNQAGQPLSDGESPLSRTMADGQPVEAEFYLRHKRGHRIPISVRALPMRDSSGIVVGAMEVFSDAPPKERSEKRVRELKNLAIRDPLTHLPNHQYMELKVVQALEDHQQFGREYGLLLVELDRFKAVLETYGEEAGNALLLAVAETLGNTLRSVDIIGRWGEEQFLLLISDVTALVLGDIAERCRALIAQSSVMQGAAHVSVTASIGATVLNHTDSAEAVLRRIDELMYQSKGSGGDRTTAG
jgi:diguanylate cyclase (GGDEF)-like protein/PAS domain S-box-containing protein